MLNDRDDDRLLSDVLLAIIRVHTWVLPLLSAHLVSRSSLQSIRSTKKNKKKVFNQLMDAVRVPKKQETRDIFGSKK
jgi:hypothetical protein